ncbi:MAG: sensor histidine kinase [Spirochaetota bacterium]
MLFIFDKSILPKKWLIESCAIIVFSFFLSLILLLIHKEYKKYLILWFKLVLLIIFGLPLNEYPIIEVSLLFCLIFEISIYLDLIPSLIFSTFAAAITFYLQKPITAWDIDIPGPDLYNQLVFALFSVIAVGVCNLFCYFRHKFEKNNEIQEKFEEASYQLIKANLQLQEYATYSEYEAMINERKRLAREIHDTLAYTLTNLVMMMEAGIDLAKNENEKLKNHLLSARDQAKSGLIEVRRAINAIRPTQINKLKGLKAISRLVKTFEEATHIHISVNYGDIPFNFGESEDLLIYRLVQEGITNAIRHGSASEISISFSLLNNGVRLNIQDNGIGFVMLKEGYGIIGMRERIEKLGGSLNISSKPKFGTLLSIWLPIQKV